MYYGVAIMQGDNMLNRPLYILITWPESQAIMAEPWFKECQLAQEPDASYFVPIKYEGTLQQLLMAQDREEHKLTTTNDARQWLIDNGILGDEEITGVFHGDQ
jgi:hypothetical protein